MQGNLRKFERALTHLNNLLQINDIKIDIFAIGGFALMCHGVRGEELTEDIDSLLSHSYSDDVIKLIADTGREVGLDDDWLNTQWSEINHFDDSIYKDIIFVESAYNFSNISVKICTLESLLKMKIMQVEEVMAYDDLPLQDVLYIMSELNLTSNEFLLLVHKFDLRDSCRNAVSVILDLLHRRELTGT